MPDRFEDLIVWQKARALTGEIYALAKLPSFAVDRALRDQICRATVSVMSNIAEGFERRGSAAEFRRFVLIAKGSCGEVRSQLYVARDLNYLEAERFERTRTQAIEVSRMLQGLAGKLQASRP
ncbi:MAG: four helix bundle protein [bacterium]